MSSEIRQISEPTTTDLRRELRRKRILETAKSRLEKLNGKAEADHTDNSPAEVLEYSDPEVEPNILVENAVLQDTPFKNPFYLPTNTSAAVSVQKNVLVRNRIHIFIASLLGYILAQYAYSFLFVPVGLCIIFEIFYYKDLQNGGNSTANLIVPIAILFTGAQLGNKIKQINNFLSIAQYLGISLGVNIFCICLSSFSFQYLNANHVVTIN